MAPYHAVLAHFPIALLTTATLVILLRTLSDGPLARATDRALVPLLLLGVLSSAAAFGVGLLVWPLDTLTATPLGRNHMLAATWTLAYWTLILVTRWVQGEAVWAGATRWATLGMAALGSLLLTITGTLGGHLIGSATAVSQILRWLGWEVYTTFYVPDLTLGLLGAAAVGLVLIGLWGMRSGRSGSATFGG
ncbi:MAG: DUF2231 domain-containing protein [Pseudomonadota bacterium]